MTIKESKHGVTDDATVVATGLSSAAAGGKPSKRKLMVKPWNYSPIMYSATPIPIAHWIREQRRRTRLKLETVLRAISEHAKDHHLSAALIYYRSRLSREDYLVVIGYVWNRMRCKHAWGRLRDLTEEEFLLLNETQPDRLVPEVLTVYRGCSREFSNGYCWVLDPRDALAYCGKHWHPDGNHVLVKAEVRSNRCAILGEVGALQILVKQADRIESMSPVIQEDGGLHAFIDGVRYDAAPAVTPP